jgi:hypothetical protein
MRMLHEVGGDELRWVQPRRSKLQFELHAGEDVVATLTWTGGSRAVGEWAEGRYWFNREGWFRPRTIIGGAANRAPDATGEPIATFAHRGGMLSFPDGRVFLWKKPKRLTTERVWTDSAEHALMRFRPSTWQSTVAVTSTSEAATLPEFPLLMLLGEYLLVLASQDAAAASSAATVAVIASS